MELEIRGLCSEEQLNETEELMPLALVLSRGIIQKLTEIKDNENYTNSENFVKSESVIDGKMVTARGDSPLHFAKNVMKALGDIPEKKYKFLF